MQSTLFYLKEIISNSVKTLQKNKSEIENPKFGIEILRYS
jgi:hypothetical protein